MRTLHLGLRVQDLARSLTSYTSLGYQLVGSVPETPVGTLTMLKLPADPFVSLELVHDPSAGRVAPGGLSHLVVQVRDVHETIGRLASVGIAGEAPSSPNGSEDLWTSWLTDRGPPLHDAAGDDDVHQLAVP